MYLSSPVTGRHRRETVAKHLKETVLLPYSSQYILAGKISVADSVYKYIIPIP